MFNLIPSDANDQQGLKCHEASNKQALCDQYTFPMYAGSYVTIHMYVLLQIWINVTREFPTKQPD